MERVLNVAKELYVMYQDRYHCDMDEMKMHKLMYFANRESLIQYNKPLFTTLFKAWKYGPVLDCVRKAYRSSQPFCEIKGSVTEETKKILSNVMDMYGSLDSWKLSNLSHQELSWKYARNGLVAGENGNKPMKEEYIRVDAKTELLKRQLGN